MARVISLVVSLAVLVAVMTGVDAGKKQKGHGGYQAPQKVIILPAGPSQTYAWVGHCPPKGKCKHIPYVKRPPFPSFHPPAPPVSITYAYPAPPAPSYQGYAPQPSAPVYSAPAPAPYEPAPQAYAPPPPAAPVYSQPDYSQQQQQQQPDYSQQQQQQQPDYSQQQQQQVQQQQAPLDFVPSAPIYAQEVVPYSASVPQEVAPYAASAPQDFTAISAPASSSSGQDYSAPAQQQQEYSAPASVQEYSASSEQEQTQYSASSTADVAPAQQEFVAPDSSSSYGTDSSLASVATAQVAESEQQGGQSYVGGDSSVAPVSTGLEAPVEAAGAEYEAAPELGPAPVEQQTLPSWGAIPDPFGGSFGENFGASEVTQFESIGVNEGSYASLAEPQGNDQQFYAAPVDNVQAVQVPQEASLTSSNWDSVQPIDNVQQYPATFAPSEDFPATSQYNQQSQQVQGEEILSQSSPVDVDNWESVQQGTESEEYAESNNYGTRIRPRGAIQALQRRRQF